MSPPQPLPTNLTTNRRRRSTVVSMHGSLIIEDMTQSQENSLSWPRYLLSIFLSKDLLESPALSTYLLVALADGVATLALFIPFTYLPDLAISKGVASNDAAFLISAAGIVIGHWEINDVASSNIQFLVTCS